MIKNRFMCVLLILAICLSLMPITAIAADPPTAAQYQYLSSISILKSSLKKEPVYLLSNSLNAKLTYDNFCFDPMVTEYDIMLADVAAVTCEPPPFTLMLKESISEKLAARLKTGTSIMNGGGDFDKGKKNLALLPPITYGFQSKLKLYNSSPYTVQFEIGKTGTYADADTYTFNFYRKATLASFAAAYEGGTKILELTADTNANTDPGEFDPNETKFAVENVELGTTNLYITAPAQTQTDTKLKFDDGSGSYVSDSTDCTKFTLDLTKYQSGQYKQADGSLIIPFMLDYSGNDNSNTVAGVDGYYTLKVSFEKDSLINPAMASFDKNMASAGYKDIPVTLTLNENALSGIWNGTAQLTSDSYETKNDTEVILYRTYLNSLPTGNTELNFKFSGGTDQTLTVAISDTTPDSPNDSAISPTTASFDKYIWSAGYHDLPVTLTLNGNTLSGIWNGAAQLTSDAYEIKNDTEVILYKSYLDNLLTGNTELTFRFSAGADQTLTVAVSDTMSGSFITDCLAKGFVVEVNKYTSKYTLTKYTGTDTDVVIPKGIEVMQSAYFSNKSITSIELPTTLTQISGSGTFRNCIALTSVKLADKTDSELTSIGENTFNGCTALTTIELPDTLTYIGESAFSGCTALTSIELPDSVTSIGNSAFNGCTALASVKLSEGLTSIPDAAFSSAKLTKIELPSNLATIGNNAFSSSPLTAVNIPTTVTSIGSNAFSSAKLTELKLPPKLVTIGSTAFSSSPLTAIDIPATVTSIGSKAFNSAVFTEIRLLNPDISLDSAGSSNLTNFAFRGLKDLTVYIYSAAPGCASTYRYALSNPDLNMKVVLLDSEDGIKVIDGGYHVAGGRLLLYTGGGGAITIPEGITIISTGTFQIDSKGYYPNDAELLASVTLPDSLVSIEIGAFCNQTELAGELIIPAHVTNITGSYSVSSFQNTKISKITILSNTEPPVLTLGEYAFANMQYLEEIHCERPVVLEERSIFYNDALLTVVSLPKMTGVNGLAIFEGCSSLKTLTIPESVTGTIWSGQGTTTGPFSGTAIEELLFPKTYNLASVYLTNGSKLKNIAFLSDTLTFNSKSFTIGGETPLPVVYVYPDTDTHEKLKKAKGDAGVVGANLRFLSYSISIAAQDEVGTELFSNPTLKTEWDDAAKAGYTKNVVPSFAPAVLDALVAAHIEKYGAAGLAENLSLDSSGNIIKAFGREGNWDFTYGGDHYSGNQASSAKLEDGKNLLFYIGTAPEESPTVLGSMVITGEFPYDTLTPILGTSIYAGSFSTVGTAKPILFASNLYEYDYYVNPSTGSVSVNLGVKNLNKSAKLRLAYSVDGTPASCEIVPSDNTWAGIRVGLASKSTKVEFTISTTEAPNDTTTYTVHIIKGDLEPLTSKNGTGIIALEGRYVKGNHATNTTVLGQKPLERLTDWGLFTATTNAINAYLYKNEQTNVIVDITVEDGAEVIFDSTKTATDGNHKITKITATTASGRIFAQYEVNYDLGDTALKGGELPSIPGISIKSGSNIKTLNMSLEYRSDIDGVYTPDKVVDIHVGIPSQFGSGIVNTANVMKAIGSWSHYISLGGIGGYATYMFDEPIKNDPCNPYGIDFAVTGNRGTGSEPGSVEVSKDGETWYYLAGSMHYELTSKFTNVQLYSEPKPGVVVRTMVTYTGDAYPPVSDYYFGYMDVASCSDYGGDLIEGMGTVYGKPRNPYIAKSYDGDLDVMDINWAVDEDGKPVYLDEISYIRVQNTIESTSFGGLSTEIGTMVRTDNYKKDKALAITEAPKTLEVAGEDILAETAESISYDGFSAEYIELDVSKANLSAVIVNVEAENEGTNIFVNKMRYDDKATYTGMLADGGDLSGLYNEPGELLLRVIVQRGDLHPRIYIVKVKGGDPDAAAKNADISKIVLIPGDANLIKTDDGYTATVTNSVAKAQLVTYLVNPAAAITVNGKAVLHGDASEPLSLKVGVNEFEVAVTSADGTVTNNTKVIITRESASTDTPSDNTISVWFTFTGDDIHYIMNPDDRYAEGTSTDPHNPKAWISRQKVKVPKGSSAKYLTDMMLLNNGIEFSSRDGGTYIEWVKIPNGSGNAPAGEELAEFSNGPNSGWMYRVNDIIVGQGYAEQVLNNGDEVLWFYTDDYTLEKNYENNWNPGGGTGSTTETKDTTIAPKVTAKDGKATASVGASDMNKAVENAKKNGSSVITIQPEISSKVTKATVELPKASLSTVASDTDASIKIVTPAGNVTIPNDVLASITSQASGDTVTMSLETVETKALTTEQQKAVGENPVFDISITSGGKVISSFAGKSITISLPYTLKTGESANGVMIWYLNDSGMLEHMTCKYDKDTGFATFNTTHLSKYVIGYDSWKNLFNDVTKNDWFYDAVKFATQKELFNGLTQTSFAPNTAMTRTMLVTVLYRLEGKPEVKRSNTLTDVKSSEWYTDAVSWASANGIVTGYGSGSFGTNDSVTREQLAAILYRYAKYKGYNISKTAKLSAYADSTSVSDWAADAMSWANAEGLITGVTETTLAPAGSATRAQVATILMRFVEGIVVK